MDSETKTVLSEQKKLRDLVGHHGWPIARRRLVEKITELQNAFNIEDGDAQKMLVDLQARKIASNVLFDWLRDVEGSASQVPETEIRPKDGYIVKED